MRSILKRTLTALLFAVALFFAPALMGGYAGLQMGTAYAIVSAHAGGPDGVSLNTSTQVPQGMFGNASLQPTNPAQAPASFALGVSAVVLYSSAQTPAQVNLNSTAEQDFTVTGVQAASVVHVQRISAAQAGLGIVGARVKAANTVSVTYCNVTAGNLTPTAENLLITEIRGPLIQSVALAGFASVPTLSTLSATVDVSGAASITAGTGVQGLSSAQVSSLPSQPTVGNPATVPPNFTVSNPTNSTPAGTSEVAVQQAAAAVLSGAPQTVIVNKPTAQAGLGYWGWVAGNGRLGLTFSNTSGAGIIPTSETYKFFACRGIALRNSTVTYLVNVGTLAAVAQGTSAEQTVTVNGVAAGDKVIGISKPTAQPGLIIGGWRVTAANTVGILFGNIPNAGGNITPTGSEVYSIQVQKAEAGFGAVLAQFSGTVAVGAINTITGGEVAAAVTGIVSGAPVIANVSAGAGFGTSLGSGLPAGVIFGGARASATNVLQLNFINVTGANFTAAQTGTAQFTVLQAPVGISGSTAGAAGSAVVYPFDLQALQIAEQVNQANLAAQVIGLRKGS